MSSMMIIPHLILKNENKIFLSRRAVTKRFWPGRWHCVTGTIENGETPRQAIVRETFEEIGVYLDVPPKLVLAVSLAETDFMDSDQVFRAVELFFLADLPARQIPENKEPEKQDAIGWFALSNLPEPIVPGVKFGLQCFMHNETYGELDNTKGGMI